MTKLKEYALTGLILFVGFALVQFFFLGDAVGYTGCNCHCSDATPTGSCYVNGNWESCQQICKGKITIIGWTSNFLSSVWSVWRVIGAAY